MICIGRCTAAALASLTLGACTTQPDADRAAAACNAPAGWAGVAAAAEGKVLIIGETHGTNEIPDAFARYVCAVSAQGGKTLVLLEYPATFADAVSDASDAADPHAVLVSRMQDHWSSRDGRGSAAMLEMVETLIDLRQSGRDLTIEPMDQMTGWPEADSPEALSAWLVAQPPARVQQMREDGMAAKIRDASEGFDRTIVLVGNIHARKAEIDMLPGVRLMAMLIPDAISLFVTDDGGTVWISARGSSTGVSTQYSSNTTRRPANSMALGPDDMPAYPGDLPAYDGYLSVGAVTASPPPLPPADGAH